MISAALRAGTPNGLAAGPERKVTTPILSGASWASDAAGANAAAVMAITSLLTKYTVSLPCDIPHLKAANLGAAPGFSSPAAIRARSEEHTSELQSHHDLVCRLL